MAKNEKHAQESEVETAKNTDAKATKVKESKSKSKKTKPNIFVRAWRRIKKFWKEYWSELKKVSWMSWKDVRKNTLLVAVTVAVFSVSIGLVDTAFGEIIDGIAGMVG